MPSRLLASAQSLQRAWKSASSPRSACSLLLSSSSLLPIRRPRQQSHAEPHHQQYRNAHILASISDVPSAYNKRIRRGRGPASGKGKTSGRGHKGQKQHGKVPAFFNGGQTPDRIVHGKRGFENIFSLDMATVNLDRIQEWIDQGRIDPKRPITIRELAHSRCVHQTKDGVKVLARGGENALKQPIHLVVSRASATAIAAVETIGGSVTTRFYTRWAIQRILRGQIHPWLSMAWSEKSGPAMLYKDFVESGANTIAATSPKTADWSLMTTTPTEETSPSSPQINSALAEIQMMKAKGYEYRLPDPSNRKDVEYYRDPAHRGYLSHLVGPTEGPSLFFLPPAQRKSSAGVKKEKVLPENRLW